MAISTLDQLIAALAAAPERPFFKASQTSEGAGLYHSLWKAAGYPAAGVNPPVKTAGSGYIPNGATLGALARPNPTGGNLGYLAKVLAQGATLGSLILYDRLWACSAFDCNINTLQAITTPGTIDRPDALGARTELWGEFYTAPGATGTPTVTVTYTNQDGTGSRSATYARAAANAEAVGQMVPFLLQAGDTGVRAVADLTFSAATGSVGDMGLTILRRIATIPMSLINAPSNLDAIAGALAKLDDNACLAFKVLCSATNTGFIGGGYSAVEG